MSEISTRIRKYLNNPEVNDPEVTEHYGRWCAFNRDQRRQIRELCNTCDMFEKTADSFCIEIERLKAEIERLKAPKYMVIPKQSNKDIWEFSPLVFTEEYTIKRIDEEGIKAEAYKELTKMLKSKCEYSDYYESYIISRNDIDYYAKEFEGGKADED